MAASPALAIVVDTDVASFFINGDPSRMPRYDPHLRGRGMVVPFAAFAELLYGAELKNWSAARKAGIDAFVRRGAIHFPNQGVCERWASVRAAARRVGRPLPEQDAWMAATALYLDLPLVTHNARHYVGAPGLRIITQPDP